MGKKIRMDSDSRGNPVTYEVIGVTKDFNSYSLRSSILSIVLLLAKDLIKLVLIAMLIATPIAWFAMNKWLEDFAYRINIGWWVFAIAGLLGIIIAFATISVKAVKAALANPVKSLRTE